MIFRGVGVGVGVSLAEGIAVVWVLVGCTLTLRYIPSAEAIITDTAMVSELNKRILSFGWRLITIAML